VTTVVEVYDERRPGEKRELRHRLELPAERITARDLIRCRIEAEVALHNVAERARFSSENEHDCLREPRSGWLVTPGAVERALNGDRGGYGPRPGSKSPKCEVESEALIETALEAFARNGFFMIFDGRQIIDLDEVLTIEDDSAAVFLRLVPLVGG
jgi:hypothetical protein